VTTPAIGLGIVLAFVAALLWQADPTVFDPWLGEIQRLIGGRA
jgi:hypothetical protein